MKLLSIEYIPGVEFEALGIVKGTVVQTKNVGKDFMAGMKTLVGGEITGYTEMLNEARQIATKRMVDEAKEMDADAVIGVKYGSSQVRPVRPPSVTPEALSTKVVVVEVPSTAPAQVAMESAISAPLMLGSLPSSSSMSALEATPIRVPRVSNRSTKRKENITAKKFRMPTPEKSVLNT